MERKAKTMRGKKDMKRKGKNEQRRKEERLRLLRRER